MKLEIKNIRLDKSMQPRVHMNEDIIAEYTESIKEGAEFPPVTVYFDSVYYWLADGYHRYFSYKSAAHTEIECEVINGTRRDAILHSVGVNDKHGLRRSNEDKRKAVLTLLDDMEWCEWSDHKIAELCRVSHVTVGRVRKSLQIPKADEVKYINKHGQEATMNVEKKKETPPPVVNLKPAESAIEEEEDDKFHALSVAHEELAEENTKLLDKLSVQNMEGTEGDKSKALETIEELRAIIKQQEAEIRALTNSRDQFQAKASDAIKQANYWRKKAEKLAKESV
jgi:ParB-like chromosome segregation protein Spo0J